MKDQALPRAGRVVLRAAVAGAVKTAATMERGTVVTLLPDGGWKYLSSGAWTDDLEVVVDRATKINYW